jgi:hypothetical protein
MDFLETRLARQKTGTDRSHGDENRENSECDGGEEAKFDQDNEHGVLDDATAAPDESNERNRNQIAMDSLAESDKVLTPRAGNPAPWFATLRIHGRSPCPHRETG